MTRNNRKKTRYSNRLFDVWDNETRCSNKQNRFVRNGRNFCKLGDPGSG